MPVENVRAAGKSAAVVPDNDGAVDTNSKWALGSLALEQRQYFVVVAGAIHGHNRIIQIQAREQLDDVDVWTLSVENGVKSCHESREAGYLVDLHLIFGWNVEAGTSSPSAYELECECNWAVRCDAMRCDAALSLVEDALGMGSWTMLLVDSKKY